MAAMDALMRSIEQMAIKKQTVVLINTYRGIPVTHEAVVLSVNRGYVTLRVHPFQAACLALQGETHLKSDLLPGTYHAQVITVDVAKDQAIVTELVDAGKAIGKRAAMRVQPKEPLDVTLEDGEHRFDGRLADISTGGMGIYTLAAHIYGDLVLSKGSQLVISFSLPSDDEVLRYQGKISSVSHKDGTFLHRLGIELMRNPALEYKMRQYLAVRQDEILEELKRIYLSMVV
jgi:hypothetical protein